MGFHCVVSVCLTWSAWGRSYICLPLLRKAGTNLSREEAKKVPDLFSSLSLSFSLSLSLSLSRARALDSLDLRG